MTRWILFALICLLQCVVITGCKEDNDSNDNDNSLADHVNFPTFSIEASGDNANTLLSGSWLQQDPVDDFTDEITLDIDGSGVWISSYDEVYEDPFSWEYNNNVLIFGLKGTEGPNCRWEEVWAATVYVSDANLYTSALIRTGGDSDDYTGTWTYVEYEYEKEKCEGESGMEWERNVWTFDISADSFTASNDSEIDVTYRESGEVEQWSEADIDTFEGSVTIEDDLVFLDGRKGEFSNGAFTFKQITSDIMLFTHGTPGAAEETIAYSTYTRQ